MSLVNPNFHPIRFPARPERDLDRLQLPALTRRSQFSDRPHVRDAPAGNRDDQVSGSEPAEGHHLRRHPGLEGSQREVSLDVVL